MKKLVSLFLALVMCLALVACGGGTDTKQPVIDAFNTAADAFDTVGNAINEDPEAYPQELIDVMNDMADALLEVKDILEGDTELTEEDAANLIGNLQDIQAWSEEVYGDLENMTIEATTVDTSKEAVIESFNYVSTRFDAVSAEINANIEAYDEEFIDGVIEMAEGLIDFKTVLESNEDLSEEDALLILEGLVMVDEWITEFEG